MDRVNRIAPTHREHFNSLKDGCGLFPPRALSFSVGEALSTQVVV